MNPPALQSDWALFLDFDGTLVPIAPTPSLIQVEPTLADMLARVADYLEGAMAVVTGRPIAEIDHYLTPLHIAVAGLHGLELRQLDDSIERDSNSTPQINQARQILHAFVEQYPDVLLEDKQLSLALHYRSAPYQEAACLTIGEQAVANSGGQLTLLHGKMVVEIKPLGNNKGDVVQRYMTQPPFKGRLPVFIGDDVTDEDGFAAVNRLDGISIHIGEPATSQAQYTLNDFTALHDWLRAFSLHPLG